MAAFPAKVLRGMRGPGRQGNARVTVRNLQVVKIMLEQDLLLVRGSVPGSKGGCVLVRKAILAPKVRAAQEVDQAELDARARGRGKGRR